jgi:hypothetical protein
LGHYALGATTRPSTGIKAVAVRNC